MGGEHRIALVPGTGRVDAAGLQGIGEAVTTSAGAAAATGHVLHHNLGSRRKTLVAT